MRLLLTRAFLTASLVACASRRASAQCNSSGASSSCTLQVTGPVRLNSVAVLSISSTNTSLTAPKASDFGTATGVNSTGPTVTVKSNGGYALSASAPAQWSGPSGANKPSTDLTISVNGGAYSALGQITHPSSGTPVAGTTYTIGYKTKYNWTVDQPGTYTLLLNYTLTAP